MSAPRIGLFLPCVVLAACTSLPPEPPQPIPVPSVPAPVITPEPSPEPSIEPLPPAAPTVIFQLPPSVRALEYFSRIRARPVRELRLEYESVRQSFAVSRSDQDRVRLALLLALPNAPFGDESQALELLEPLTRDSANDYQPLAQLVSTLLVEQRRRASHATALQQKLDRIMALEKELQRRAATPESRTR